MQGILADINARGHVEYLVHLMPAEPWAEFWQDLGLVLFRFEDVGLSATSSDLEIWLLCQEKQLILITVEMRNRRIRSRPQFVSITRLNPFRCSPSQTSKNSARTDPMLSVFW